jgi:TRAP-type C4-dicarboxylate transport system permease small subunit
MGMVSLYNFFPNRFKKAIIVFSAGVSSALFIILDIFMIQAIYDEVTIFNATSAALGIPVWIYYAGVPLFSVFVFKGIYMDASFRLSAFDKKQGA